MQILIFESSSRRRHFRDTIPLVRWVTHDPPPPERLLPDEFFYTILQMCKSDAGQASPLINVTLSRDPETKNVTSANMEAICLAREVVCSLKMSVFLTALAKCCEVYWGPEGQKEEPDGVFDDPPDVHKRELFDSDSDEDGLPRQMDLTKAKNDEPPPKPVWKNDLKKLKACWFLSEADAVPKVTLDFGGKQNTIHFFSEVEKQRWRQKLSSALRYSDEYDEELQQGIGGGRAPGMKAFPTVAGDFRNVKKHLKEAANKGGTYAQTKV